MLPSDDSNFTLPELNIRGRIYDTGTQLTLCCGRCGSEVPIKKISEVRVYAHNVHMIISFDLAHMVRHGEYSLLCEQCASADQPALVAAG